MKSCDSTKQPVVVDNMYIYIYVYIQLASKDYGSGLFMYSVYEGFHINLRDCSMYGYCYKFFSGLYKKTHIQKVYNVTGRKLNQG